MSIVGRVFLGVDEWYTNLTPTLELWTSQKQSNLTPFPQTSLV